MRYYHFTTVEGLLNILKSGKIRTEQQHAEYPGSSYVSLTKDPGMPANCEDTKWVGVPVRIEVSVPKSTVDEVRYDINYLRLNPLIAAHVFTGKDMVMEILNDPDGVGYIEHHMERLKGESEVLSKTEIGLGSIKRIVVNSEVVTVNQQAGIRGQVKPYGITYNRARGWG